MQENPRDPAVAAAVRDRLQLHERLECKTFDWYLSHVMPEMQIPPVTAQYYGNVSSKIMDQEKSEGNSRLLYKPVIQFRHKDWDAKFLMA